MKVTRLIAPFVAAAALMGFSNVHALTLELDMDNVPATCDGQSPMVNLGGGIPSRVSNRVCRCVRSIDAL